MQMDMSSPAAAVVAWRVRQRHLLAQPIASQHAEGRRDLQHGAGQPLPEVSAVCGPYAASNIFQAPNKILGKLQTYLYLGAHLVSVVGAC